MIPTKSDPVWRAFVTSDKEYEFSSFATKIMYSRVKQLVRLDEGNVEEAVEIAHSFFEKNINIVEKDLALLKS